MKIFVKVKKQLEGEPLNILGAFPDNMVGQTLEVIEIEEQPNIPFPIVRCKVSGGWRSTFVMDLTCIGEVVVREAPQNEFICFLLDAYTKMLDKGAAATGLLSLKTELYKLKESRIN